MIPPEGRVEELLSQKAVRDACPIVNATSKSERAVCVEYSETSESSNAFAECGAGQGLAI